MWIRYPVITLAKNVPGMDLGGLARVASPLCSLWHSCCGVDGLIVLEPLAEPSLPLRTGLKRSIDFCSRPAIRHSLDDRRLFAFPPPTSTYDRIYVKGSYKHAMVFGERPLLE